MTRRSIVSVVGDAGAAPGSEHYALARALGRLLVDASFRVMTGGLGGVMAAACRGAHDSDRYREGDTIGILPHADPRHANEWVDIVLPTGLDHGRNAIVANADAVIAVGGGAGTLSEIAFAWLYKRLIVAVEVTGWSADLAGRRLDHRIRHPGVAEDCVYAAKNAEEAVMIVVERLPAYAARHSGIRSGLHVRRLLAEGTITTSTCRPAPRPAGRRGRRLASRFRTTPRSSLWQVCCTCSPWPYPLDPSSMVRDVIYSARAIPDHLLCGRNAHEADPVMDPPPPVLNQKSPDRNGGKARRDYDDLGGKKSGIVVGKIKRCAQIVLSTIGPAPVRIEAAPVRIEAAPVRIGPARVRIGPARVRIGPAPVRIEAALSTIHQSPDAFNGVNSNE